MRLALACTLLLFGCHEGLELPTAPTAQATPDCASATTSEACAALSGCFAWSCPVCHGSGEKFQSCEADEAGGRPFCPSCATPTPEAPCSLIVDATTCDARPDCHAIYSGEELCNSLPCTNHFEGCVDGDGVRCATECAGCQEACPATNTCPTGYARQLGTSCCADGCVLESKCEPTPCA